MLCSLIKVTYHIKATFRLSHMQRHGICFHTAGWHQSSAAEPEAVIYLTNYGWFNEFLRLSRTPGSIVEFHLILAVVAEVAMRRRFFVQRLEIDHPSATDYVST